MPGWLTPAWKAVVAGGARELMRRLSHEFEEKGGAPNCQTGERSD